MKTWPGQISAAGPGWLFLPIGPGIFLVALGCLLAFFVKLVDLTSVSMAQRQDGYDDEKKQVRGWTCA